MYHLLFFLILISPLAAPLEGDSQNAGVVLPSENQSEANVPKRVTLASLEDSGKTAPLSYQPESITMGRNGQRLSLIDAVTTTLANQLDIQIAVEQFYFSEGVLQESAGPFDPEFNNSDLYTVSRNVQNPPLRSHKTAHRTLITAEASKTTRLGTKYSLALTIDQQLNPLIIPPKLNTAMIVFAIEQPLLRGYMYGTDAMVEQANYVELQAAYYDVLQRISLAIFNTAVAYWDVVAANKVRAILAFSVERFQKLIKITEELISEQQVAASDVVQPLAQLASRKIDLQLAEQNYYRAIEELKFAMNTVEELACATEDFFITDDFPELNFSYDELLQSSCYLLRRAASSRFDVIAAQKRVEAAGYLVQGARNETLPEVNLVGSVGQKNFSVGSKAEPLLGALQKGPPQTDYTIGVTVNVPLYNDSAIGVLKQRNARQSQLSLQVKQLIQQGLKDLRAALTDQMTLAKNLKESNEAVKENNILVQNELKKLNAGLSTVFFVIDFENRQTDSLIQQVQTQKDFLQNIVRLRFLSATLFNSVNCIELIEPKNLISLPAEKE